MDSTLITSPAAGLILSTERVLLNEEFSAPYTKIAIYLSVLDDHKNYFPFDGMVTGFSYHEGDHIISFHPKSADLNEHTIIEFEDKKGNVVFVKQIAGFLARRILCLVKPGDSGVRGQVFGKILLGSQVDIFVPEPANLLIKPGDRVIGGQTILATLGCG